MNELLRIGITHGDINGVGYEVMLKMLDDSRILELGTPIIYGSAKIAGYYRKALNLQQIQLNQIGSAAEARDGVVNIINVVGEEVHVEPGHSTPEGGKAALAALEAATVDVINGDLDAIVTCPINKHNIQSDAFHFAGHTEYLEEATNTHGLMILFQGNLRVALVTTHLPVKDIASHITREAIGEKLHMLQKSLIQDFGLTSPRIAVLSLNPHAGDSGLLGSEETDIIIPAIEKARAEGIMCFGPYGADGFFGSGAYTRFDAVLAMYHDQGLAPFKTIAMDSGVNFTAGLPIVRTSPDHGTGYDIVCQGIASEQSLREALYSAIDIVRNRRAEAEATANPLRRQYFDKSKDNVVLDLTDEG